MKFGIIGTNFVSEKFMRASKMIVDFNLIAVCSQNISNAESFAKKHNADYFTNNYRDFLTKDLDAVYIAVPNSLHKDLTIFFLDNKIPVLCEKPMASNIDEVKEMIEASKKNNTLLAEGIIPIYTKAFKVIKNNLNKVGTVRRAILGMGQYSSRYDAYREGTVLNAFKPELSNGSIMDIGIYPLSFAIGLFGKPLSVMANAYTLNSDVDGLGTIIMGYKDKEVIVMHSKITDQLMLSEIQGEDGSIQFNDIFFPTKVIYTSRNGEPEILFQEDDKASLYYELDQFVDALKNDLIEVPTVTHQMIIDVHTVLTKARSQTNIVFPADL